MNALLRTSLAADERVLLERFVEQLRQQLGDAVHSDWLFGSRARGEQPAKESDVDLLVLVDDASWDGRMLVREILYDVARELELEALPWSFSVHVHTPAWLEQRHQIRSFFITEVDRDKVVLSGAA